VEANKALAEAVNVAPSRFIASEAANRSIFLIYISTDYVFSGKPGEAPYNIQATTAPPNAYGQTKYDGEVAVLEETSKSDSKLPVPAVVLRVPLLYGHCEKDDPSKSAVHPLVDAIWKAQNVKVGEPKVKVDDYALRYPTATEDVGRVCLDIAKLYTEQGKPNLPRILHFSSEDQYTKYGICKLFAEEILALPIENLEPHDPTKDEEESKSTTVRPYNTHLDTTALKELGINIATLDFLAWWYVFHLYHFFLSLFGRCLDVSSNLQAH
jgi:S-adenosylmethionine synthetase